MVPFPLSVRHGLFNQSRASLNYIFPSVIIFAGIPRIDNLSPSPARMVKQQNDLMIQIFAYDSLPITSTNTDLSICLGIDLLKPFDFLPHLPYNTLWRDNPQSVTDCKHPAEKLSADRYIDLHSKVFVIF